MAVNIKFDSWSNPSTIPNNGKYASITDMPYSGQQFTYRREYGNIVHYKVETGDKVQATMLPYNRIQPLFKFGSHLPANSPPEVKASDSELFTGAWDRTPKYL